MKAKRLFPSALTALVTLVGLGTCPVNAQPAQPVAITINNQRENISWTATYDSVQNENKVFVAFDAGTFTINKNVTFKNNTPIIIHFTENAVASADSADTGGLRNFMDEILKNRTSSDWIGFTEQLKNVTPVCRDANANFMPVCSVTTVKDNMPFTRDVGSRDHPQFPHFHDGTMFTPFSRTAGGERKSFLEVGNGKVPTGGEWDPRRIVLHDAEVQGFQRKFDLIEMPVPNKDRDVSIMRELGLGQLQAGRKYTAELAEPKMTNMGESLLITIRGLTWDNPTEFRFFANEEAPPGGTNPSERLLFFNQAVDPGATFPPRTPGEMAARVVLLSDNEDGQLPPFPQGVTDPMLQPIQLLNFEGPLNLRLSGNNGTAILQAMVASEPKLPVGTPAETSDVFMFVPEPATLTSLAVATFGLLAYFWRPRGAIKGPFIDCVRDHWHRIPWVNGSKRTGNVPFFCLVFLSGHMTVTESASRTAARSNSRRIASR